MKKSIIIMTLLSFVLVLTLAISGCKKGGDQPKGDHPEKTESTDKAAEMTDHPEGEHPKGDE